MYNYLVGEGIGGRIRERRRELGLSQVRLAGLAGLTQQHLSLIEHDRLQPRLVTLRRLCACLGLELVPRPQGAELWERRLAGLRRFNAWEEAFEPEPAGVQQAFAQAGDLARLRRAWAAGLAEDWEERAREWNEWRRRLPRQLP